MLPGLIGLRAIGLAVETAAGAAAADVTAAVVVAGVADAGATDAAVMVEATAAAEAVGTKILCHGFTRIWADKSLAGCSFGCSLFLWVRLVRGCRRSDPGRGRPGLHESSRWLYLKEMEMRRSGFPGSTTNVSSKIFSPEWGRLHLNTSRATTVFPVLRREKLPSGSFYI